MDHWFTQKWTFAWYLSLCLMYSLMMGLYEFAGTYIIMFLFVFIQCVMHVVSLHSNVEAYVYLQNTYLWWGMFYMYRSYVWWINFVTYVFIFMFILFHVTTNHIRSLRLHICVFELSHTSGRNSTAFTSSSEAARHSRSQRHRLMHRRRDENLCKENRFWLVHLVSYNVALISDWCQIVWRNRLITIGVRVLGVNLQCAWSCIYI